VKAQVSTSGEKIRSGAKCSRGKDIIKILLLCKGEKVLSLFFPYSPIAGIFVEANLRSGWPREKRKKIKKEILQA